MPTDHSRRSQEIYLLGGNVDLEIARVSILERLKIQNMGGLFAERNNDFSDFTHILDLESRTATWALNVAQEHPELEIICFSWQSSSMSDYAQGQAEAQGLYNINFFQSDENITGLNFPDNSFDLINASNLFSFVLPYQWPAFLKECLRITRPGGFIRLVEGEWGTTNSPAIERLSSLFLQGLKRMGLSLSPDGRNIGTTTMLGHLLKDAGWQDIKRRAFIEDYMIGPSVPQDPYTRVQLMANLMRKNILDSQLATSEEIEDLLEQAVEDVRLSNFCGIVTYISFCACKAD